ncbi:MAG: FliH/SctL family protein [Clostridia bacterium]|nr:FliH/SctL family protein [Clostridia bacterium]
MSRILKSETIYLDINNPNSINEQENIPQRHSETEETSSAIHINEAKKNIIQFTQSKAKNVLDEAQQKAEKIIQDAQEKRDSIYREAQEQGYQQGYIKGEQQGEKLYQDKLEELEKQRSDMYKQVEDQVVDLAVSIAERMVNHDIYVNRDRIINLIRCELNDLNYKNYIILRTSEEDYDYLKDRKNDITVLLEQPDVLKIKPDTDIPQGSFMLETEYGIIDKRIKTQIDIIKKAFLSLKQETNG